MSEPQFNIANEALLLRLSISQFTGHKSDPTLAKEAALAEQADADSIKAAIKLVKDCDRKPISQLANTARSLFYERTVQFEDGGWRLVGIADYQKLKEEITTLQNQFIDQVNDFIDKRDDLAADSEQRLNTAISSRFPFPTEDQLREMFKWSLDERTISDPKHVILRGLEGKAQAALAAAEQARQREAVGKTQEELVERIVKQMQHVVTKLNESKDNGKAGTFRDSLIGNVREMVDNLPKLNLTNNPEITAALDSMKQLIAPVAPKLIRDDKNVRQKVAGHANTVLNQLSNFKPRVD